MSLFVFSKTKGKAFLCIACTFFILGCFSPKQNIQVAGIYAYPEEGENKEIYEWIVSLTSSNFFEYTQAARKLIEKGKPALPMLYKYKHLTREVNGINLQVCPPTIKIILQQFSTLQLEEYKKIALPGLVEFVEQEFENRKLRK